MKNNKGFSLVELIVVIAIMAILAAVAVIGVSVYIPKAQKAADQQLVSDIEQALNLSMQSQPITDHPIGKLVLSTEGVKYYAGASETPLAGTDVEEILINAFGSDYQNKLKLKFDEWTSNPLITGMQAGEASLVKDSSYMSGNRADQLLQDVESFTEMAANLAGAMDNSLQGATLASLYGDDLLNRTAEKYDIKVDKSYNKADGSVDWDAWGKDHPQEFSNMLVLATSLDSQSSMNDPTYTYQVSSATTLVQSFSTYYAFAATCPQFSPVLDKYLEAMNSNTETTITSPYGTTTVQPVTSPATGAAWYIALENELKNPYKNENGMTYADYIKEDDVGDSAAFDDQLAFMAIMSSLSNVKAEDVSGDLSNTNLFTNGAVKNQYDQYLGAVDLMYGYSGDMSVAEGEIAIIYNQNLLTIVDSIN